MGEQYPLQFFSHTPCIIRQVKEEKESQKRIQSRQSSILLIIQTVFRIHERQSSSYTNPSSYNTDNMFGERNTRDPDENKKICDKFSQRISENTQIPPPIGPEKTDGTVLTLVKNVAKGVTNLIKGVIGTRTEPPTNTEPQTLLTPVATRTGPRIEHVRDYDPNDIDLSGNGTDIREIDSVKEIEPYYAYHLCL
jgi:hypothetical protein